MSELALYSFEGSQVETLIENDEILFEVYSVGMALGQAKESKGRIYPHKERIDKNLQKAEIRPVVRGVQRYINENELYDLMLEMRTEKCRRFKKWLSNDVLPQIRKTGGYIPISENDTESEIMAKALVIAHKTIEESNRRLASLEHDKSYLETKLGMSEEWFSVKRVARLNNISWKNLNWRHLKETSHFLEYGVGKEFDANYGEVNTYHINVWKHEYPHLYYGEVS